MILGARRAFVGGSKVISDTNFDTNRGEQLGMLTDDQCWVQGENRYSAHIYGLRHTDHVKLRHLPNGINYQIRLVTWNRVVALFRDDAGTVRREGQHLPVHLQADVLKSLSHVRGRIVPRYYASSQDYQGSVGKVRPQVVGPFRKHQITLMAGGLIPLPFFRSQHCLDSGAQIALGGIDQDHPHDLLWTLGGELADYDAAQRMADQDLGRVKACCW